MPRQDALTAKHDWGFTHVAFRAATTLAGVVLPRHVFGEERSHFAALQHTIVVCVQMPEQHINVIYRPTRLPGCLLGPARALAVTEV